MNYIEDNLKVILKKLPENVRLIAVSKFHSQEEIIKAYNIGQRIFGESKMQELVVKYEELPKDIEWHFVGNLQTNKVKHIAPFIDTIHSIDSWRLLKEVGKQASKVQRKIKCLIEIHIAEEDTKQGLSFDECKELLSTNDWRSLEFVEIIGVMGMATFTDDISVLRKEFKSLKAFFEELKQSAFKGNDNFREISMGMSNDYEIAIEEGATLIRVGSSIFGARE